MNSRRRFIQKLSSAALIVPTLNSSDYSKIYRSNFRKNPDVLRVAIMGLGSYGTRVAEAMKDCTRAKLAGVISGTPSKITAWQQRYNIASKNCYNYENFDQVKDNPDIDAVYVITPNGLHHDEVLRVAASGKHVICEKPMGLNARQCKEMIDACKVANVRLLVGYRMHFEPHTLAIIAMRKSGSFGKITFFQGLSGFVIGDPGQWRLNKTLSGGGALMDIGIYSVNGSRYMIGEDPVWVTARETKNDPVKFKDGIDETIQFEMGFPGGAVASCLSTYSMNNLDRFFLDGLDGFAELNPASNYGPIMGRTNSGPIDAPIVTHQTIQMDEMSDIILRDKKPIVPVDGEEALKDLTIMDAIYESVKTDKKIDLHFS
jgi:predicted dehydrogenase